ncbi:MAG: ATP-binding cassette domain-containing protein [Candidatus Hodarchaeales archaeon]|jgi:ABC-type lipoprotein export system ATPase subunit
MSEVKIQSSNQDTKENSVPFLRIQNAYMIYKARAKHASVVALKGVSAIIEKGDFIAVVGPSGSGKSSLFKILGGIQQPTAGSIIYEGIDITKLTEAELTLFRKSMVGFVFQEGNLLSQMSAYTNVNEAMAFNGYPYQKRKKRTLELLDLVGVKHRKDQIAFRLSGGEKQRVAIARAMANNPKLIIADEPTGNVDFKTGTHILELFRELNREIGMTFLLATHSSHVAGYANRSMELRDGILIGQHGIDVDLSKLDISRMVMMDSDYRITIPEHIMEQLNLQANSLWIVEGNEEKQILLTTLEASSKTTPEPGESIVLMDTQTHQCLVCGAENPITSRFCNSCGAKF